MLFQWRESEFPRGTRFWAVDGTPVAALPGKQPRRYNCIPPVRYEFSEVEENGEPSSIDEFLRLVRAHIENGYLDEAFVAYLESALPSQSATLHRGSSGPAVLWLQWQLYMWGFGRCFHDEAAHFGVFTEAAVHAFQHDRLHWLSMDEPTGIADPETIYELGLTSEELHIRLLVSGL